MSQNWNYPIKRTSDLKYEDENTAKIIDSGNSKNNINIFSDSTADSKSVVKADAEQEQEQEQEIDIEEG